MAMLLDHHCGGDGSTMTSSWLDSNSSLQDILAAVLYNGRRHLVPLLSTVINSDTGSLNQVNEFIE